VSSKRAIVLLSGGLDSATILAMAQEQGFELTAITFQYGQRHAVEVTAARRVASQAGVLDHVIVEMDLRPFGGSALTSDIAVPRDRSSEEMASGIPVTYVPARNTIFLSYALAMAEVREAFDIFAGMNALDFAGYPDCRPEYVSSFEAMANLATKSAVESGQHIRIHTPLMQMTKADIIREGARLGVDYSLTSSCYDPLPSGEACAHCDACRLRLDGFQQSGLADPGNYRFE
jgi:7-cyano-7-deazaguanine synthase